MRDNFWKWLKRFFVVLPIIVLLLNLSIFVLRQNGENLQFQEQDSMYNEDFIGNYIYNGMDGSFSYTVGNGYNPLFVFNTYANFEYIYEGSVLYTLSNGVNRVMNFLVGENTYDTTSVYVQLISSFLVWWIFVELVFLFFRFVTFLISWVNSLFDNTFKKVKK